MTSQQPALYQKAKPIFEAAIDLPTQERAAFVRRAAAGQSELEQLVLELLSSDDDSGQCFAQLDAVLEHADSAEDFEGAVLGRYTLVERIGEGGFGTVWRAEQKEPVQREVALKVIKLGMDTRQVVARFEAERQALALMDHPHIASVHDGGSTPGGRPYFAMELVDGVPIHTFCRQEGLALGECIELFRKVCAAIEHAHQKGVIHRDIKPSNVLIRRHGDGAFPKVIDFGLAKATSAELTKRTLITGRHQILGTPEYMAPEQVARAEQDIDTRTDVYALGVLLFELLTGARPFELQGQPEGSAGSSLQDFLRAVVDESPPRPSTRTDGKVASASALRGDLDWILLRALEKDPARRYSTVNALSTDLARHLRSEPVIAGPPSRSYRVRKFVARNRVPVAAAGLLFLAVVAGLIGTGIGLKRAWRAERVAISEKRQASDARDVATREARSAVLARGDAEREARRARAAEAEAETQAASARERLDLAMRAIRSYHGGVAADVLLRRPEFAELRERLLRAPVEFYEQLSESLAAASEPRDRLALIRSWRNLASIEHAVGRLERAVQNLRLSAAAFEDLLASGLGDEFVRSSLDLECAELLCQLGVVQVERGRTADGLATLRRSLGKTTNLLPPGLPVADPSVRSIRNHQCDVLTEIGTALQIQGDLEGANESFDRALAVGRRLVEESPQDVAARSDVAGILNSLGRVQLNSGDPAGAKSTFAEMIREAEQLVAEVPGSDRFRQQLANAHTNLGNALSQGGDSQGAIESERRGLRLLEELYDEQPGALDRRAGVGNAYNSLGVSLGRTGDADGATAAFERAVELLDGLESVKHLRFAAQAMQNLARNHQDAGEEAKAGQVYERAVATYDALFDAGSRDMDACSAAADCHNNFALLLSRGGPSPRIATLFRRSIELRNRVLEAYPKNVGQRVRLAGAWSNLGDVELGAGNADAALTCQETSLEALDSVGAEAGLSAGLQQYLRSSRINAYWGRAEALAARREFAAAAADWGRIVAFEPGEPVAQTRKLLFLSRQILNVARAGAFVPGEELYEQVIARDWLSPAAQRELAMEFTLKFAEELPAVEAARQLAAAALRRLEESGDAPWFFHHALARAEFLCGNLAEALAVQRRTLEQHAKGNAPGVRAHLEAELQEIASALAAADK